VNFFLTGIFFLALTACARPDYLSVDPRQQNHTQDQCALIFSKNSLCANVHWSQGPQTPAESEFILKFWNSKNATENGPYNDPAQNPSVVLWMPSMGHGSSPVKVEKLETGVYRIKRVYFIMSGEWEVRISLKNADGSSEQQTLSLVL